MTTCCRRLLPAFTLLVCVIRLEASLVLRPIPLTGYDADLGLGFGISATLYSYSTTNRSRYDWMLYTELYATTGGELQPVIIFDIPSFKIGTRQFRLEALLTLQRSLFSSYYGYGEERPTYSALLEEQYYYSYKKLKPALSVTLSTPLFNVQRSGRNSALSLLGGFIIEHYKLEYSQPDSGIQPALLFDENPRGVDGGGVVSLVGGLRWDSRDSLTDPHSGMLHELRFEFSYSWLGSSYDYTRITFKHCSCFALWPGSNRLILAQRLIADWLPGAPPFFKAGQFGATEPLEGIGSMDTMRGVAMHRYIGDFKLLYTPELRWDFWQMGRFLGDQWHLEAVFFSDIGSAVDSPGDFAFDKLLFSYGIGLRIFWGKDFCIAADFGLWKDDRAFYLGLNQQF